MTAPTRRDGVTRFVHRAEAGAAAGLLAAIAVAILFLVEGALHLHPFAVPSALASGLLGGGRSSAGALSPVGSLVALGVEILQILAYTVLHLLAFAAVGAMAAFVLDVSSLWRGVMGGAAYASVACTALLYLVRWIADIPVALEVLGVPRVLLVNAFAGAIIGISLYLTERSDQRAPAA